MVDNKCGTCTACCKVYSIPEFNKPAGDWCQHCDVGKGCKIYDQRPPRCVEFQCFWLQAQEKLNLPIEARPDKCKVVFSPTTNPYVICAITMPGRPDAWRGAEAQKIIKRCHKAGVSIAVSEPRSSTNLLLRPDGTSKVVEMTEPDEDGMQYTKEEHRLI